MTQPDLAVNAIPFARAGALLMPDPGNLVAAALARVNPSEARPAVEE